jgi:ferric-dicitrate binding protein FerR (iron transport regulator)
MSNREPFNADDAGIADLLRKVGARAEPSAEIMREVQEAVHAQWREVVAARQHQRRRTFVGAAAASICVLVAGTVVSVQLMHDQVRPIATLQRSEGEIFLASDDTHWARVSEGQRVTVGDSIRSDSRAALLFDNGLALRIDRGTAFKVSADNRLALNFGAVYIDSKSDGRRQPLTIDTHSGAVRHLGTQYQVRMRAESIEVSVREGRVLIEGASGSNIALAGERVEISTVGAVIRGKISPTDEQWRWASEVAPTFAIENASMAAFLDWIARETGRALVYESPSAKVRAAKEILHGSIEGLAPDVALAAVLATTPLRRDEANDEVIEIGFARSIDSQQGARPTP